MLPLVVERAPVSAVLGRVAGGGLRGEGLQLLQLQPPNDVWVEGQESRGGQQDGGVGEGEGCDGRTLSPSVCSIVPLAYLSHTSEQEQVVV
jgi:hypothetical protein